MRVRQYRTQGPIGLSAGRFALTPSPEERPSTRRISHGTKYTLIQCASASARSATVTARRGSKGFAHPSSKSGNASRLAKPAAIRVCPSALACRRSACHNRGSPATGKRSTSSSSTPVSAQSARTPSLNARSRGRARLAKGATSPRSGIVMVSTVAPIPRSATCKARISAITCSTLKCERIMSLVPENTVAKSGRIASAGCSCSSTRWRVLRPRTARLA